MEEVQLANMPTPTDIDWLLKSLRQPAGIHNSELIPHCPEVEWGSLLEFAGRQGLSPLLFQRLQSEPELWHLVPSSAREQLQQSYLHSAQRNLLVYHQFSKLIKRLKAEEIPVIALKGIYLAHFVYGDRALRPMGDADILVKQKDVLGVENILLELGFQPDNWKHREWCLKNHYHLAYMHPVFNVSIEVHWHIQRPQSKYSVAIEALWNQAQPVTIAGVEILGLSYEHLLLHHCLHIAKHDFQVALRSFYDLAKILHIYHQPINWQQVHAEGERWQITKSIVLTLCFTHEFFGGVPDFLIEAFNLSEVDQGILGTVREQILAFRASQNGFTSEFIQFWENSSESNRLPQVLQRVFLPPELLAGLYNLPPNSWRLYLYYPVRMYDLLTRYSRVLGQLSLSDKEALMLLQTTKQADIVRKWLIT